MGNAGGSICGLADQEATLDSEEPGSSLGQRQENQRGGLSTRGQNQTKWWTKWHRTRRKINFLEPVRSRHSIESMSSIERRYGSDQRPLKSSLKSTTSTHSGSSVRFQLPPEHREHDIGKSATERRNSAEIGDPGEVLETSGAEPREEDGRTGRIRGLFKRTSWRIALCLICGVVVPLFLVIPILVTYEDLRRVPGPGIK